MTNDFDELISAYIDGATTPEETARVDADPELRAAADRLRALAGEVGRVSRPTPEMRSAHLAAALYAFDGLGADEAGNGSLTLAEADSQANTDSQTEADGVVSLDQRRARRQAAPTSRPGGIPSWLGAAAAAVVVVGGLGVAFQLSGSSDDDAALTVEESSDAGASTEAVEVAESESESDDAAADFAVEAEESAEETAAALDEADADESADGGDDDGEATPAAEAGPAPTPVEPRSTTTSPGLFPTEMEEARVPLEAPPTAAEQEALLAENETLSPSLSACGELFDLGEPVGFLPLSVAGAPGELIVYLDAEGVEQTVAVDGACQPLPSDG